MANFKRKISGSSSASIPGLKIEDFQVAKQIGSGRFGKVFLVRHRQTRTIYALKKMSKKMIKGLKMEHQVIL
jgi:serine/threonine protein kinase